jgi:hypothetical protein
VDATASARRAGIALAPSGPEVLMQRDGTPDHREQDQVVRDNEYYTDIERHEDWLDPKDTGDISRPQGWFWYQNERPGADELSEIDLEGEVGPGDKG